MPDVLVAGERVPVLGAPSGVVHVPPGSGPPIMERNRSVATPVAQSVIGSPVPALLALTVLVVTVALAEAHGAAAAMV